MPTLSASYDRFKELEQSMTSTLPRDGFHIIRLDGRSFRTYTRGLDVPFDPQFAEAMNAAAIAVAKDLGAVTTYVASDEISVVLTCRGALSELPFGGDVAKLLSQSASMVTAHFNAAMFARPGRPATFDSRVITVPSLADVHEYLQWRQGDTFRNAVRMAAATILTHNQLVNMSNHDALMELHQVNGQSFELAYPAAFYRGRRIARTLSLNTVTYTHSRTKEEHTVEALTGTWEAPAAPAYRYIDMSEFQALLTLDIDRDA